MNKSTVVAIIILVLIIGGGIVETEVFATKYGKLEDKLADYSLKCLDETITVEYCEDLLDYWLSLREVSEIFYANIDLYELNLRITDACAFVKCGDYKQAYNQFKIAEMLSRYIPELIKPNIQHII